MVYEINILCTIFFLIQFILNTIIFYIIYLSIMCFDLLRSPHVTRFFKKDSQKKLGTKKKYNYFHDLYFLFYSFLHHSLSFLKIKINMFMFLI